MTQLPGGEDWSQLPGGGTLCVMTGTTCTVGSLTIGPGHPLAIIAGPCVLEDQDLNMRIGKHVAGICRNLELPYIFKASFDKANRSSIHSNRGPGLDEGLALLKEIRTELNVPITTDVHEPAQAQAVAEVADLLQVPAFLCRQTDLLVACGKTDKPVNIKKGQFLSPSEMRMVITKLHETDCRNIILTERGTFFGYNRLVNDFIGLGDMMNLGQPVCFDVTHSTQLPGAGKDVTAGRPEHAPLLARAATAAGVHTLFIECHPDPKNARSDGSTVQSLEQIEAILHDVAAIRAALTHTQ